MKTHSENENTIQSHNSVTFLVSNVYTRDYGYCGNQAANSEPNKDDECSRTYRTDRHAFCNGKVARSVCELYGRRPAGGSERRQQKSEEDETSSEGAVSIHYFFVHKRRSASRVSPLLERRRRNARRAELSLYGENATSSPRRKADHRRVSMSVLGRPHRKTTGCVDIPCMLQIK